MKDFPAALSKVHGQGLSKPVVVVVCQHWVHHLRECLQANVSKVFVACRVNDPAQEKWQASELASMTDAFFPLKFGKVEVEWCLEQLRLWWLTRGDGPEDDSEPDSPSDSPSEPED